MDKKWWTLIAVCAGIFMLLLDVTIVIVAQPSIQSGLHASFSDVQWTLDAYALTLASLLLTSGSLADRYGRKLLFTIGLVVFTVGSLLCGVAVNPLMLILSRSGQGIGGAIMMATSLALLGNSFRGRERGVAFGIWGAVVGISSALGPVLGGVITTEWDWRGIFLVNIPVGVFALIVTVWRVEESRSPDATRPDWAGFVLLTLGLVTFVYGLIRAGETTWSDTGVIACLAAGVVLLALFLVVESRVAHPMFDLSLLRVPTFAGGSIAAFAMNGSLYAVLLYFVIYLQDVLGYSALGTGLRVAILSLAQLVTSVIAGRVSERVPTRWLIGPGLLLVGIGLLVMTGLNGLSDWTHLIPGFIVGGLGAGLVNPPLASTAIGVVPPAKAGMASGVNSTFRQIGIAAGIAALGSIFVSSIQSHLTAALPASLAGSAGSLVNAVRQGSVSGALGSLPAGSRAAAGLALRSSFASALNELLYVTAGVALVGAVFATVLIRRKDFVRPDGAGAGAGEGAGAGRAAETVLGRARSTLVLDAGVRRWCSTLGRGWPGGLAGPVSLFLAWCVGGRAGCGASCCYLGMASWSNYCATKHSESVLKRRTIISVRPCAAGGLALLAVICSADHRAVVARWRQRVPDGRDGRARLVNLSNRVRTALHGAGCVGRVEVGGELSLLSMTPMVKLSRMFFLCLALMLVVFAVWALAGFGYQSAPVPFAMNVVSKILAFVTALSLFFPEWSRGGGGVGRMAWSRPPAPARLGVAAVT